MSEEVHEPGHSKTRLRRTGRGTGTSGKAGDTTAEEQAFLMGEPSEAAPDPEPESEKSDSE
ncbi:MAG: hypothetical protein ACO1QR_07225 [Chthoniobacteraceae bacterium]